MFRHGPPEGASPPAWPCCSPGLRSNSIPSCPSGATGIPLGWIGPSQRSQSPTIKATRSLASENVTVAAAGAAHAAVESDASTHPPPPVPGVTATPPSPPVPGVTATPPSPPVPGVTAPPPSPPVPGVTATPPSPPVPGVTATPPSPATPFVDGPASMVTPPQPKARQRIAASGKHDEGAIFSMLEILARHMPCAHSGNHWLCPKTQC